MQYLGGKTRLAKQIAAAVAPRGLWWEPFCGGLSVSVQLAKYGPGIVSDANPALIALYRAVRYGWAPPASVDERQYAEAKSLPNGDPRKAAIGFGCSFGGKWFGGYARGKDYAAIAARSLLSGVAALGKCELSQLSFFDVEPGTWPALETIYADPPYEGTTGYSTGEFDHAAFWARCQAWSDHGVRVFVSEYQAPVAGEVVLEATQAVKVRGGTRAKDRTERLFRILPTSERKAAA